MSYEAWGEPPDDPELPEGALSSCEVEELQELLKLVDYPDPFPRPGNRSDAALIMIDYLINPPLADKPEDPTVLWARTLLRDVVAS